MKWNNLVFLVSILGFVTAQTNTADPLDQLISEAFSVYTQVTSIIASAASAASVAATASSSRRTLSSATRSSTTSSDEETSSSSSSSERSSSGTSPSSPSLSTSASASSTASRSSGASSSDQSASLAASSASSRISPIVGTSSVLGATAETGTAISSASTTGSSGEHKLAIILGSVLGALALGLFILALIICCKRRRHRSGSPRHRALSPGDDEVDSWRVSRPSGMTDTSSHHNAFGGARSAPLMSQHPAFRGQQPEHENPFVPVPPPPRRSAPNARAGLTDGIVAGDDPFLEKETGGGARPNSSRSRDSSDKRGGALAAGVAGVAVGAGLLHHHNRKQQDDEKTLVTDEPSYPATEPQLAPDPVPQSKITRKPVPINTVNNSEPWPYSPVSPIDPAAESEALTKFPARSSQESRRSFSRDAVRANAAFDQQYSPQSGLLHEPEMETSQGHGHGHGQALATAAAGLALGGIGGAALAHHHDNQRRSRSSSSSGHRHSHSQSPRPQPGPIQNEDSNPLSLTNNSSNDSYTYSDALATQLGHIQAGDKVEAPMLAQQPAPLPPPQSQSYTPSDPYDIPPVPTTRSRRNSALGTAAPNAAAYSYINRPAIPSPLSSEIRHDRSYSPPRMPSRSPRRSSRGSGRASQDSTPYDDVYSSNPWVSGHLSGYQYTEPHDLNDAGLNTSGKAIVGDNGYPHMGIPRRKSGGEYEFGVNGPFGPQTIPVSQGLSRDAGATRSSTLSNSDDSTWRLSSGMPGGWRRASGEYSRLSGEQTRRIPGRLKASDVRGGDDPVVDRRYYESVGQAL